MTLIDRLDAAAGKTGIPGLAMSPPRRRRFRWLPILALLLGLGGYLAVLLDPVFQSPGLIAVTLASVSACWLPMVGPLKVVGGGEIADEFDRAAGMRSYLVGLGAVAFFAFVGLLMLAGLALMFSWTRDMLLMGVIVTAMMIQVIGSALPTLHASWTLRPLDDEDD